MVKASGLRLVSIDGESVTDKTTAVVSAKLKSTVKPKPSGAPPDFKGVVLNGRGYRDKELASQLETMSIDLLDGYISNLEADLSLMTGIRNERRRAPLRDFRDRNRRIVDIEEPYNEDDILRSEYGNEFHFKYFGATWEMTVNAAASKKRPELAGRTVRYAYGNPVR